MHFLAGCQTCLASLAFLSRERDSVSVCLSPRPSSLAETIRELWPSIRPCFCHNSPFFTDPYHASCLPLHIAVLVDLKKSNDLFYLAHNLVDIYPGKAVAWFAVGCYYMLVNKHETARRFDWYRHGLTRTDTETHGRPHCSLMYGF